MPGRRLGRAALYALGASTLTLASACSAQAMYGGPVALPEDAAVDSADSGGYAPHYGLPPLRDAAPDVTVVAAYGAPALPLDGGTD